MEKKRQIYVSLRWKKDRYMFHGDGKKDRYMFHGDEKKPLIQGVFLTGTPLKS